VCHEIAHTDKDLLARSIPRTAALERDVDRRAVQLYGAPKEFKALTEKGYSPEIKSRYRRDFDEFYKKRSSEEWTTVPSEKK
jgi:hypothetical protein